MRTRTLNDVERKALELFRDRLESAGDELAFVVGSISKDDLSRQGAAIRDMETKLAQLVGAVHRTLES